MPAVVVVDAPVTRLKVVTPLVIIPDETQGQLYVYKDQYLPSYAPAATREHLLATHCVVPE